jgi:nitrite reductase (NADH) small subunit
MIISDIDRMSATTDEAQGDAGYVAVCDMDELPVGLGRAFDVDGRRIAIFRTRAGSVHAVDNRCPHKGGPLAEGMLAGSQIVCPLHAFRFELSSGECDQPGTCGIQTYAARVHEGTVFIKFAG